MREALYTKIGEKVLEKNTNGGKVHHIVGTPGLGKSWSFIALKLLHDKRISSLMKNGPRKDSIFTVNYKLFYLHAMTERKQFVKKILSEVKTDFGEIPDYLKVFFLRKWDIESNNDFN